MIILSVDTSFDDTAAAVIENLAIRSNIRFSEVSDLQIYGGVVPRLARLSHEQNLPTVVEQALKKAKVNLSDLDAIAVTVGPGLAIALEIGIAYAKELATKYNKPLIAVNHMEGHLLSFLANPPKAGQPWADQFPALAVLVSGGHTEFVYAKAIGEYEIVGQTQDDAMGEAFDKVGRMLGLGYPAGRLVELMARKGIVGKIPFPVPMRQVKDANMSFSGLKTAASRIIEKYDKLTQQDIADIALGFQTSAITHLIEKLEFALKDKEVKSIILGGGVGANREVRHALRSVARTHKIPLLVPYSQKLYTDNAAMIGVAAYFQAQANDFVTDFSTLDRQSNLSFPRRRETSI
ncbi:MAG TPA: tRNA (adenosine(37)-N6)-threonylcarbamoyltransferase complex transferase subunit TsaD [Patescibacteria group bacterium]|nr:tRNA (adenosine(37)-N6)-threonylcarbamoyltransferase complex transferase subunit TsaD [Patescibacteria group bacterium]